MLRKKSLNIIKTGYVVLSILLILFLCYDTSYKDTVKFNYNHLVDPASYILEKFRIFDVVFLGTKHRQKSILNFISGILPRLHEAGVSHLGLEIASDQQPHLDYYIENGIDEQKINLHHAIDCPEYRDLLEKIRKLGQQNVLKPIALDLPPSLYESHWNRDEWMAISICSVLDGCPDAKILVIVGNLHALKKIVWDDNVPNKNGVIRNYLSKYKPELKVFSICQCTTDAPDEDDLAHEVIKNMIPVAFDCSKIFTNCKMNVLDTVAAKPMKAHEITDGVVMYWENKESIETIL